MRAILAMLLVLTTWPATAQDAPDPTLATTVREPTIGLAALSIMLRPLPQGDLQHEIAGWQELVQATDQELSEVQLRLRRIADLEAARDAGEAPPAAVLPGPEVALADRDLYGELAGDLLARRGALLERFDLVLDEYEAKGGDPTPYRLYARTVRGVDVDWTDPASGWQTIRGWATSEEGGIALAQRVGVFAAVLIGAYLVGLFASWLLAALFALSGAGSKLLRRFVVRWSRRVIFILGALIGLSALGVNITPLVAALGAAGFVVGFALQNTLSNFASGLLIMTQHPFDVGDAISAAGVTGTVDRVSLFSTHITTFDNSKLIVPNNAIWSSVITNSTAADTKRLDLAFDVKAPIGVDEAERTLAEVLAQHPKVLDEPAPLVRMDAFTDDGFKLVCWPWVRTADAGEVRWDVIRAARQKLHAEVTEKADTGA